jgi:hypothetical protein
MGWLTGICTVAVVLLAIILYYGVDEHPRAEP